MTSQWLDALREFQVTRVKVQIVVDDCWYACCARPAARRAGYEQSYEGVIADVDEERLILHSIALETLNYHVIADLDHVQDVTTLVD